MHVIGWEFRLELNVQAQMGGEFTTAQVSLSKRSLTKQVGHRGMMYAYRSS